MSKPKTNNSQQTPKPRHFPRSFRNLEDASKLIELMGETGLAELDIEMPQFKMSLRKTARMNIITESAKVPASLPPVVAPLPVQPGLPEAPQLPKNSYHQIISPMAGTFYRAPSPTSDPYIKEGDVVTVGQSICIVEAMKLMNEIKSDKAGKVIKILTDDASAVEKGSVLIEIDENIE